MNVVSNAPEYDKKRPGHKKKSTTTTKKNVTNSQNSINLSPKNPYKKKKNVLCLQNFLVGQKSVKTRSSTAIVHPGAVATPPE